MTGIPPCDFVSFILRHCAISCISPKHLIFSRVCFPPLSFHCFILQNAHSAFRVFPSASSTFQFLPLYVTLYKHCGEGMGELLPYGCMRLHATACGMRAYTLAKQPFLHSSLFMLLLHSTIYVYDIGVLLISSINYPVLFTSILWLFERNRTKSVHLKGSTRSSASNIENV